MARKKTSRPGKDREVMANTEVFCSSCLRAVPVGKKYVVGWRPAIPNQDKRQEPKGGWVPVRLCSSCW